MIQLVLGDLLADLNLKLKKTLKIRLNFESSVHSSNNFNDYYKQD